MKDKTVAILESRMPDHIASLVRKYGGTPFSAPALAEIPDVDPAHIQALIRDWTSTPPDIFIFQTGAGTRALFAVTESLGLTGVLLRILDAAQVVVRGPKPATAFSQPGSVDVVDLAAFAGGGIGFLTFRALAKARSLAMKRASMGAINLAGSLTGCPVSRPKASA
jgi:hypothetical protein